LLIVAESRAVLDALAEHPRIRARARRIRSWRTPPFFAVWLLRCAYRWTNYFADAVRAQRDARLSRHGRPAPSFAVDRPRVLMHSCLDETYFGSDGEPRDRYFPALAGLLGLRGFDVVTLPWLYNLRRSRRSAFEWFRARGERYLIPEDYYRPRDYLWAASVVLRQLRLPRMDDEFQGLRVRRLVSEARWLQAADPSIAKFIRYYRLIERCSQRSMRIDVFIDMFENMASEKPAVMAFRRWMPRVLTVGYQHFLSIYPLLLNLFASAAEGRVAPHPDIIVWGSALGIEQWTFAGFSADKLRAGPTLRYQYLLKSRGTRRPDAAAVLIMVPMESLAAKELLTKLLAAFGDDGELAIRLRLHPMMSRDLFNACVGSHPLPVHFTIVGGTLDDCLDRAGCVVAMAGSSALEVALNGVPVVTVGRDTDFDFNPLQWFPEFPSPAHDAVELRTRVRCELHAPADRRRDLEAWALQTLKRAVAPVTDERVMAFVTPPSARATSTYA
jgi:hypothetical protein